MKFAFRTYAKAFLEAVKENSGNEDILVKRFVSLVERHGLGKHTLSIIEAVEEEVTKARGGKLITIETARMLSASLRNELLALVRPEDRAIEKINPELISGVRITVNGSQEIDTSLQKRIREFRI